MPTTINVNAAGYDLDAGGVTGSIVSGTLFLGHASNLGGQLRAKAITDTPAIIAQAYSGTANALEVWDSLGNVVASISKTGAAAFDGDVTIETGSAPCLELRRTDNSHWKFAHLNNALAIQNNWAGAGYNDVVHIEDGMGIGAGATMRFAYNGGDKSVLIGTETPSGPAKLQVAGAIKQGIASGAIDPTTSDFTSGTGGWWKNTGANEIRFWYNDSGTMKKSGALTT